MDCKGKGEQFPRECEICITRRLESLISCVFVDMRLVHGDGPEAVMECRCGHRFNVDACTEENLRLVTDGRTHRELVAFCSRCGAWDRRSWMVPVPEEGL